MMPPQPTATVTLNEILDSFRVRTALLVHCSREGKGDDPVERVYPDDLRDAIDVLQSGTGELSCSVVWPDHLHAYGSVGIVLRPRGPHSIKGIGPGDAGTTYDRQTRRRDAGLTVPLTETSLARAFDPATSHNEWVVEDADVVGIYLASLTNAGIAVRLGAPGGNGRYETDFLPQSVGSVRRYFPDLPVFVIDDRNIVCIGGTPY